MSTALAPNRVVSDLVTEYQEKADALPDALKAYEAAEPALNMACTVMGTYAGNVVSSRGWTNIEALRKNLLTSAWKAVYTRLQIDMVASANDKKDWERFLADPIPFTMVAVREKFGAYLLDPWTNVLRGLAEVFCDLDPAYKSHSKVKIGVKGLPKRVILTSWDGYSSGRKDKLRDIINAIRAYERRPLLDYETLNAIIAFNEGRRIVENPEPGIDLRIFGGAQTCHVIFKPDTLLTINRALAEYYGEVLPDAEPDDAKPRASTAVSKDLAYYPTPQKVVDKVLGSIDLEDRTKDRWRHESTQPKYILEPSCGDGRFLDEIARRGHRVYGVEVHAERASEARAKGHPVLTANFLQVRPDAAFDLVVMNPPFAGRHWVKHVEHALKFLKAHGRLVCVLPATAHYDEHLEHAGWKYQWRDLPVGSFAESGTNVPTGYAIMWKPA